MKKFSIVCMLFALCVCFVGCGKVYDSGKSGYITVSDIYGINFDVYASSIKSATAISEINKDSDMSDGNSYLYKNGSTDYIIYNNNSLTIVVQKINTIDLKNAKDKEEALSKVTFLGTTVLSKDFDYETSNKDNAYKLISQVDAGVSLTLTTFGDYTGQVAYLSYNGNDYMMFVGVPKTDYKELNKDVKEAIEYMAKSLRVNKEDFKSQVEKTKKPVTITNEDAVANEEDKQTDETNDAEKGDKDVHGEQLPNEENVEKPIPNTEIPVEDIEVDLEDIKNILNDFQEGSVVLEKEETTSEKEQAVVDLTNQTELEGNETSIYALGKVKDEILASGIDVNGNQQTVLVKVTSYYNEEDAVEVIKNGVEKDGLYPYFEAKDGCHFEAVEYSVSGSVSDQVYVNFKLVGIDGQNLKYKGVSYGSRTYDILATSKVKEDGFSHRICYYEVPNGCKEYVLQFGEVESQLGYVKISN